MDSIPRLSLRVNFPEDNSWGGGRSSAPHPGRSEIDLSWSGGPRGPEAVGGWGKTKTRKRMGGRGALPFQDDFRGHEDVKSDKFRVLHW